MDFAFKYPGSAFHLLRQVSCERLIHREDVLFYWVSELSRDLRLQIDRELDPSSPFHYAIIRPWIPNMICSMNYANVSCMHDVHCYAGYFLDHNSKSMGLPE